MHEPMNASHADELARIGGELSRGRKGVSESLTEARNAALAAAGAGMPELRIAKLLGVNRSTVRDWLGKR